MGREGVNLDMPNKGNLTPPLLSFQKGHENVAKPPPLEYPHVPALLKLKPFPSTLDTTACRFPRTLMYTPICTTGCSSQLQITLSSHPRDAQLSRRHCCPSFLPFPFPPLAFAPILVQFGIGCWCTVLVVEMGMFSLFFIFRFLPST